MMSDFDMDLTQGENNTENLSQIGYKAWLRTLIAHHLL